MKDIKRIQRMERCFIFVNRRTPSCQAINSSHLIQSPDQNSQMSSVDIYLRADCGFHMRRQRLPVVNAIVDGQCGEPDSPWLEDRPRGCSSGERCQRKTEPQQTRARTDSQGYRQLAADRKRIAQGRMVFSPSTRTTGPQYAEKQKKKTIKTCNLHHQIPTQNWS